MKEHKPVCQEENEKSVLVAALLTMAAIGAVFLVVIYIVGKLFFK